VMVAGLFLLAGAHRRGGFVPKRWWGALLLGAGGFQLYDGIVQHKLLGLHQIRYHVTIWAYDLTWNMIAVIMILATVVMAQWYLVSGRPSPEPGAGHRAWGHTCQFATHWPAFLR